MSISIAACTFDGLKHQRIMINKVERRWGGRGADERRAERRGLLLLAAIKVYSENGFRNSSVKSVCEAAGLTERYFYESFANSEELLIAAASASLDYLITELRARLEGVPPSDRLRTIIHGYFAALREQPAHARAFLVDIRGISPAVDAYLETAVETFAELIVDSRLNGLARVDRLMAIGAVGAIAHVALDWIVKGFDAPIEDVVEAAVRLATVAEPSCSAR
jgi:AcrR family transcriptional regulator